MGALRKKISLKNRTISIIGGTGGMGRLFVKVFKNNVKEVVICSRSFNRAKKFANEFNVSAWPIDESNKADVVIVSVPIDETYRICKTIIRKMYAGSLLIEISSVKHGIADKLSKDLELLDIEYLSLHPLFGPKVKSIKGRRVVFIPIKSGPLTEGVVNLLRNRKALLVESGIIEHDKSMAAMQVAHHFAFLTLIATLKKYSKEHSLKEFETESFRRTKKTLKMIKENYNTIVGIQKKNPYAKAARKSFANIANDISNMDSNSIRFLKEIIEKI
jgi:prephenate dehydrogenase